MMNFGFHSGEHVNWESSSWREAKSLPGVRYLVRRPSLAKRAELTRLVRGKIEQLAFRNAGETLEDRLLATELELAIDRLYVEWGVIEIVGLEIDGEPATVNSALDQGPETLSREMASAVREELMITEAERKN